MPNGYDEFRLKTNQRKAATTGTGVALAGIASEFMVAWLRKIDPVWLWPHDMDTKAIILATATIGYLVHAWVDYRLGSGKRLVPGSRW